VSSGPRANEREDSGHEEECGDCGKEQAADDCTAKRRILFATFAEAKRYGHHADDYGGGGHDDRTKPCGTGFNGERSASPGSAKRSLAKVITKKTVRGRHVDAHNGSQAQKRWLVWVRKRIQQIPGQCARERRDDK
jgi:hypothetical protein